MNQINEILNYFKQIVDSKTVKEPPTKSEIIDKLCTLGVDNPGFDNTSQVENITNYVLNIIRKYEDYFNETNKEINLNFQVGNSGGYRLIKVHFLEDNIPGALESICIYIPVIKNLITKNISLIYSYLLSNRISFLSKISFYNRSDNFTVTVYNKEDAKNLINFCNNNLSNNLAVINPFVATIGNVGISRQLYKISYNLCIASLINEYIEECILNQRKKPYDAIDFQNFVNEQYKNADNYIDKNINYIASASLYCILTNENILKFFKDDISLVFDYDNYCRYQAINISSDFEYLYNSKIVNKDTDYISWIKLQALNCLNKIYIEQYNEPFKRNTKISQKFTFKILEQLDNILNKKGSYNIKVNYKDIEIQKLIPYLYGYTAYRYKSCNEKEIKDLIELIRKILIFKKNVENDKIIYEQDNQKIISSFPIINTINGSVAIDIIDYSTGMSNITIIKKGKREKYLNVYVKINYDLLRNTDNFKSKRYRYQVSKFLLNESRNEEALAKRKNDFSALFFDDTKL